MELHGNLKMMTPQNYTMYFMNGEYFKGEFISDIKPLKGVFVDAKG